MWLKQVSQKVQFLEESLHSTLLAVSLKSKIKAVMRLVLDSVGWRAQKLVHGKAPVWSQNVRTVRILKYKTEDTPHMSEESMCYKSLRKASRLPNHAMPKVK